MSAIAAVGAFHAPSIDDAAALQDVTIPRPQARPTDLLVRVEAVSVNPVDAKQRRALARQRAPRILGFDAAGTVEEVGPDVVGFAVGDAVYYAGDITRPGSNADLQAVDSRVVAHKPGSLGWAESAAIPLTAITAWESLFDRMHLDGASSGTLLIVAGAGGVGSAAIQLARLRTAARVLATAARPESRAWVEGLGAHAVVDRRNLAAAVLAAEPAGVDHVLSPVTGGNIEAYGEIIKPFGSVVVLDDAAGLDVSPLKARSIAWQWESMFTRTRFDTPDVAEQGLILTQVARLVDEGRYRSTVTKVIEDFSADGLREAHRLIESASTIGKIVVAR